MMFPHEDQRAAEFGRSPGNGITPAPLSRDPLATEGEATPGPDDHNPYEERENEFEIAKQRSPTEGDDPFTFDDVDDAVGELELPSLESEPDTSLFDW